VLNCFSALYFQAVQGDSAVEAGIKILPMLMSTVVSSIISGGLVTAFGYYNAIILIEVPILTVGAGLIATFWLDTPFSKWFGYQVSNSDLSYSLEYIYKSSSIFMSQD
jgi:hypothetical protein